MSYRRIRDSQPLDRVLLRAIQHKSYGDNTVLDCSQHQEEDLQPIVREKVEIPVAALKKGKFAAVDNIPAELIQAGGEPVIDVLQRSVTRSGKQENGQPMMSVTDYYIP